MIDPPPRARGPRFRALFVLEQAEFGGCEIRDPVGDVGTVVELVVVSVDGVTAGSGMREVVQRDGVFRFEN